MMQASAGMQTSRRKFLRQAASCLAVATAGSSLFADENGIALIGSQLYGWGQYYQREGKNLAEHLPEVFSALRDAGYDYAEGFMDVATPENNAKTAEVARQKGLKPVCIYSGAALHDASSWETNAGKLLQAAAVCARSGYQILNCNPDAIGREKTDAELSTQAKALDFIGAELNKIGMRLGVHNHTPEMANKAREFRWNFDHTNPQKAGFCFDVHWVFRGGMAPAEALKLYGERLVSWHLRQSRDRIWWEDLDDGDVDYHAISKEIEKRKLPKIFSVELALESGTKVTRSVVENHQRSIKYVREVLT
jgi:inosose dehydratase